MFSYVLGTMGGTWRKFVLTEAHYSGYTQVTVADFSLSCIHTFLNSEENLLWPVPDLQTADG